MFLSRFYIPSENFYVSKHTSKVYSSYWTSLLLDSKKLCQTDGHLPKAQWAPGRFPSFLSALLCERGPIHKWKVLPLSLDRDVSEQSGCLNGGGKHIHIVSPKEGLDANSEVAVAGLSSLVCSLVTCLFPQHSLRTTTRQAWAGHGRSEVWWDGFWLPSAQRELSVGII